MNNLEIEEKLYNELISIKIAFVFLCFLILLAISATYVSEKDIENVIIKYEILHLKEKHTGCSVENEL